MADGAQKSSVDHKIRQSMLFTDFIHPVKHLQLHIPDFLHFIRNSVIGNSFLLRLQFINIFPNQLSVRRHPPVKRPIGILFSHLLQKKHLFLKKPGPQLLQPIPLPELLLGQTPLQPRSKAVYIINRPKQYKLRRIKIPDILLIKKEKLILRLIVKAIQGDQLNISLFQHRTPVQLQHCLPFSLLQPCAGQMLSQAATGRIHSLRGLQNIFIQPVQNPDHLLRTT